MNLLRLDITYKLTRLNRRSPDPTSTSMTSTSLRLLRDSVRNSTLVEDDFARSAEPEKVCRY